ncbi:hypothetical protein BB561_000933 [Smittium simulii]|uniref:Uncharacterized protein n=1 Tax=Smittium simulii TaxID=133385 RepID=A0A2T9YX02_9FUNG|nr:hypothetical protein BB561_000933 [Smittium simulii]
MRISKLGLLVTVQNFISASYVEYAENGHLDGTFTGKNTTLTTDSTINSSKSSFETKPKNTETVTTSEQLPTPTKIDLKQNTEHDNTGSGKSSDSKIKEIIIVNIEKIYVSDGSDVISKKGIKTEELNTDKLNKSGNLSDQEMRYQEAVGSLERQNSGISKNVEYNSKSDETETGIEDGNDSIDKNDDLDDFDNLYDLNDLYDLYGKSDNLSNDESVNTPDNSSTDPLRNSNSTTSKNVENVESNSKSEADSATKSPGAETSSVTESKSATKSAGAETSSVTESKSATKSAGAETSSVTESNSKTESKNKTGAASITKSADTKTSSITESESKNNPESTINKTQSPNPSPTTSYTQFSTITTNNYNLDSTSVLNERAYRADTEFISTEGTTTYTITLGGQTIVVTASFVRVSSGVSVGSQPTTINVDQQLSSNSEPTQSILDINETQQSSNEAIESQSTETQTLSQLNGSESSSSSSNTEAESNTSVSETQNNSSEAVSATSSSSSRVVLNLQKHVLCLGFLSFVLFVLL